MARHAASADGRTGDGLHGPTVPSTLAHRLAAGPTGVRYLCGMGVCLECERDDGDRRVRQCLERRRP